MPAPPLPFKKVEEMFLAYCKKSNPQFVARTCDVSWHTAQRYIEVGDSKRGIRAFRTRLRRVARLVERHTEEKIAYSRSVAVAATWDQLEKFDDIIDLAAERLHKVLMEDKKGETKIRLTDLAKALEISAKVKKDFARLVKRTDELTRELFVVEEEGEGGDSPPLPALPPRENPEVMRVLTERIQQNFTIQPTDQVIDTDGQPVARTDPSTSTESPEDSQSPTGEKEHQSTAISTDCPSSKTTETQPQEPGDKQPTADRKQQSQARGQTDTGKGARHGARSTQVQGPLSSSEAPDSSQEGQQSTPHGPHAERGWGFPDSGADGPAREGEEP